jgi:diaminopimelate epimerase
MPGKKLHFSKISATGNDFILIDNRNLEWHPLQDRKIFQSICQRRQGVGADGIILLQNSTRSDFEYIHINSDGSIAEMCGNGSRAIAFFAKENGIAGKDLAFDIQGRIYRAHVNGCHVTTEFIPPQPPEFDLNIIDEPDLNEGGFIDTGVPHFVLFVKNIHDIDTSGLGRKYRHHPRFKRGSNIDFVQIRDEHNLLVRTYERGVEAETLACGTGAVATAVIAFLHKHVFPPVDIHFPGGTLQINFDDLNTISLSGSVTLIYMATLEESFFDIDQGSKT